MPSRERPVTSRVVRRVVIVIVGDEPVSNVEIADIGGANPGSPRYDLSMTNNERRSFPNLILLCKPHHNIVDRLHPDDYPADALFEWKTADERAARIDGVALATVDEDCLIGLIERAVQEAGPQRRVRVEIGLGIADAGSAPRVPIRNSHSVLRELSRPRPSGSHRDRGNQGSLKAFVTSHAIRFVPIGGGTMGMDTYPWANPACRTRLTSGSPRRGSMTSRCSGR